MSLTKVSSLLAILGIALGAFGAHALRDRLLATGSTDTWETAVFYHLVHAIALFCVGLLPAEKINRPVRWAARLWIGGIALFSGSLYLLALFKWSFLGPVTPVGGLLFMAGWAILLFSKAGGPKL